LLEVFPFEFPLHSFTLLVFRLFFEENQMARGRIKFVFSRFGARVLPFRDGNVTKSNGSFY